jgi:hypothetical protein
MKNKVNMRLRQKEFYLLQAQDNVDDDLLEQVLYLIVLKALLNNHS